MHSLSPYLWRAPALHRMSRGRHGPHFDPRAFWHGPWRGMGFGGPGGRRSRARRGDVRAAILLLLAEEPRNGYGLMQEIEHRSDGAWNPSPGSVYPALAQLEDEGLIATDEHEGRKLYALTDAGRKAVDERGPDRPAPWEQMSDELSPLAHQLGKLIREVGFAFAQVMRTGSEAQMRSAKDVLAHARRDLYKILAEGEDADATVGED